MAYKGIFVPTPFATNLLQNSATNITTNNVNGVGSGNNFVIQASSPANGDYMNWAVPGTPTLGIYQINYTIFFGGDTPKIDVSYQANGAGGFTNLRTGIDTYSSSNMTMLFTDYFQVTTTGSINLRFTANTKNASSSNYNIVLGSFNTCSCGLQLIRIK